MADLKIVDFAVILRNIVDLGKPQEACFDEESAKSVLQDVLTSNSEWFMVASDVAQRVCSLAKHDIIRLELPDIEVLDVGSNTKRLYYCSEEDIIQKLASGQLSKVNIALTIHRSGVLLVNFHMRFQNSDGMPIDQAIENARINLRPLVMKLPVNQLFRPEVVSDEDKIKEDRGRFIVSNDANLFIGSLKDLVSEVIRPNLIKRLSSKFGLQPLRDHRCISSTLLQIYAMNPACDRIDTFVMPAQFGREIHGLGSLDRAYKNRSENMVTSALGNDLADDEEAGVFTFGLSDLIMFDSSLDKIVETTVQQKKYKDRYAAVLYNTTHYSCLLEWVYLEKYILDLYNRMLSRTIARKNTSPEEMLVIQKQTMHDLIGYKAGITPFPSREDFWEKARVAHRIPEAQEKFEKKRDLATDYVIQEYTLRTNKSIQLINIFISATAAFSLMQVIVNIWQPGLPGHKSWWVLGTMVLFAATSLFLWCMNRFFLTWSRNLKR